MAFTLSIHQMAILPFDEKKYGNYGTFIVKGLTKVRKKIVVSVSSNRRQRGGSWYYGALDYEVGYRDYYIPFSRGGYYGFRLVRSTQ